MSNSLEDFLRGLIPQLHEGGGEGMPQTINITTSGLGGIPFMVGPGMTGVSSVLGGRGRGGGLADGSPTSRGGRGSRAGAGGGRGAAGSVYSGAMPPMMWIQQEQQRTPQELGCGATPGVTDGTQLRESGNRAFKDGKFAEAIEYYTRAAEAEPALEINYTNRSFAYYKLGDFSASAKDAEEAIRLKPTFYKGHFRLGLALMGKGEYQAAIVSLTRALDLAPEGNTSSIEVSIAKCRSKLARIPATPLLTNSCDASGSASPYSSPLATGALGSAGPLDFEAVRALADSAASTRADVDAYVTDYEGEHDIVECQERAKKVRELMNIATSGRLAEVSKDAREKQESLRRTLKGQDRGAYFEAKKDRDIAYQHLWDTAEQVQQAIAKLRAISREEQSFFSRFGNTSSTPTTAHTQPAEVWHSPGDSATEMHEETVKVAERMAEAAPTDEPADATVLTPPVASPTADPNAAGEFARMLRRRAEIEEEVAKSKKKFAWTDATGTAFRKALEDEVKTMSKVKPLLEEAKTLNAKLEKYARTVAQTTTKELSDNRLEALDQVYTTVERSRADEQSFKQTQAEGDRLLDDEAKLERERLLLEKQRIQLQAEVEWYKVRDEPEQKIVSLQRHVKQLQQRVAEADTKQKQVQKRILELVETDHPELAWKSMASGSRILRLVKGSGLWLNLSLSDFQVVSTLSSTANSKVLHVTRRGEHAALKEVSVNDERARRRLQREVKIVAACSHPNVVRIKGVFFDGPFAYIVLPYYHRGSLRSLLQKKEQMPWLTVQDLFRQLASGVAYLHERGIVHGDIKPSNVLIADNGCPVIADFGIAKDSGRFGDGVDLTVTTTTTATGAVQGTAKYMAPEQLREDARLSTFKSDIWALGVTFYEVATANALSSTDSGTEEPASPLALISASIGGTKSGIADIPPNSVGGDVHLADLISSMLTVDVGRRFTAYEVLGHPYFSSPVTPSTGNGSSAALAKSDERIEAVRSFIHAIRAAHPQKILVSVSRNQMVESLRNIIPQLSDDEMLEPIMVVFQGEAGIDEGALTSEMLSLFYVQMVSDKKAFVCSDSEENAEATADAAHDTSTVLVGTTYLPAEDEKHIPTDVFTLMGKVLLKSIVENRALPFRLNASVLKYFCSVPATILDLEEYDRDMAESLKRLRLLSSEDLAASDLNFSHFTTDFLAKQMDGKYIRDTVVTTENVRNYVDLRVQFDLIEKRRNALEAIKNGFYSVACVEPHLKLLSPSDLLLLLCGVQHVPAQTIVDALEFQGFDGSSKTPQYLKEIILSLSQNNLRRFLELCTSNAALPANEAMKKIKVLRTADVNRLPVGHGCVSQLDLPDYNDKNKLQEKLEIALAHVSDGFHIV